MFYIYGLQRQKSLSIFMWRLDTKWFDFVLATLRLNIESVVSSARLCLGRYREIAPNSPLKCFLQVRIFEISPRSNVGCWLFPESDSSCSTMWHQLITLLVGSWECVKELDSPAPVHFQDWFQYPRQIHSASSRDCISYPRHASTTLVGS
jgi:hypothetical protein